MSFMLSGLNFSFVCHLAGINLGQPIVTSCGTGVTACVLALVCNSVFPFDVCTLKSPRDNNVSGWLAGREVICCTVLE